MSENPNPEQRPHGIRARISHGLEWVDCHPRTGWWLASLSILNILLTIVGIFSH